MEYPPRLEPHPFTGPPPPCLLSCCNSRGLLRVDIVSPAAIWPLEVAGSNAVCRGFAWGATCYHTSANLLCACDTTARWQAVVPIAAALPAAYTALSIVHIMVLRVGW